VDKRYTLKEIADKYFPNRSVVKCWVVGHDFGQDILDFGAERILFCARCKQAIVREGVYK